MSERASKTLMLAWMMVLAAGAAIPGAALANGSVEPDDEAFGDATANTALRPVPKVILISLDGAKPDLIDQYLRTGVLPRNNGLGLLRRSGVVATQNITATPSLTAVAHVAIATGSTAVNNDIPANSFHPVAATISTGISGFAAPIGGYQLNPLGPSPAPTAEPLWVRLRDAGKTVVAATWPGADGASISISGVPVQVADPTRVVDYGVPFGAFGGVSAQGYILGSANFAVDASVAAQLTAAGHPSYSPVKATPGAVETIYCAPTTVETCGTSPSAARTLRYDIRVAAFDSTDDGLTNYDTLVVFDQAAGIQPGPFRAPRTGPAYIKVGEISAKFFYEGSGNVVGAAYFPTLIAPDLSSVHYARYSANYIPRNAAALAAVDDINNSIGFWRPQPDFRIVERLSSGFTDFSDPELEALYKDQVRTFTKYQTRVALRAIRKNRNADLVMVYFEQPDGSGHQFLLTDPRQASTFTDPTSIGTPGNPPGATGQDPAKVARYQDYLRFAYIRADRAVSEILHEVGIGQDGKPRSNVFVVSDHGFAPFHTAVGLRNLLTNAGIDPSLLAIRTSGPAANIYVNLQGREAGGTVSPADYPALVTRIASALRAATDDNPTFNGSLAEGKIFGHVIERPTACGNPGFCTDERIGQDYGDVFAMLDLGYNFDGTQSPGVARLGDQPWNASTSVLSVSNFYGAHGYDAALPAMSASFIASGPQIRRGRTVPLVHNIDVAPTIMQILGVTPAPTVDGTALANVLR